MRSIYYFILFVHITYISLFYLVFSNTNAKTKPHISKEDLKVSHIDRSFFYKNNPNIPEPPDRDPRPHKDHFPNQNNSKGIDNKTDQNLKNTSQNQQPNSEDHSSKNQSSDSANKGSNTVIKTNQTIENNNSAIPHGNKTNSSSPNATYQNKTHKHENNTSESPIINSDKSPHHKSHYS